MSQRSPTVSVELAFKLYINSKVRRLGRRLSLLAGVIIAPRWVGPVFV